MAKAYGDDLRRKLLEAHDRGEGTLLELAERFSVSGQWAWKISAQRKHSGQMERIEQRRRGRISKITPEVQQQLRRLLREQADATLAELQERMQQGRKLHISLGLLWKTLRKIGLRLKKSHSMPKSRTRKKAASNARSSSKPSARSRRKT
jgi:transposase